MRPSSAEPASSSVGMLVSTVKRQSLRTSWRNRLELVALNDDRVRAVGQLAGGEGELVAAARGLARDVVAVERDADALELGQALDVEHDGERRILDVRVRTRRDRRDARHARAPARRPAPPARKPPLRRSTASGGDGCVRACRLCMRAPALPLFQDDFAPIIPRLSAFSSLSFSGARGTSVGRARRARQEKPAPRLIPPHGRLPRRAARRRRRRPPGRVRRGRPPAALRLLRRRRLRAPRRLAGGSQGRARGGLRRGQDRRAARRHRGALSRPQPPGALQPRQRRAGRGARRRRARGRWITTSAAAWSWSAARAQPPAAGARRRRRPRRRHERPRRSPARRSPCAAPWASPW